MKKNTGCFRDFKYLDTKGKKIGFCGGFDSADSTGFSDRPRPLVKYLCLIHVAEY